VDGGTIAITVTCSPTFVRFHNPENLRHIRVLLRPVPEPQHIYNLPEEVLPIKRVARSYDGGARSCRFSKDPESSSRVTVAVGPYLTKRQIMGERLRKLACVQRLHDEPRGIHGEPRQEATAQMNVILETL
jgi:hypothetical protein